MTTAAPMHKPEAMHLGKCPVCRCRRICVLLYPKGDRSVTRRYYIRKHHCGTRISPMAGSLQELSSSEVTGSTR
jgi:hypothetical protein